MKDELKKCRAQLDQLAGDRAQLQRNAASAQAEAEAGAEQEQVFLHRALEASREEQKKLERADKGIRTAKKAVS